MATMSPMEMLAWLGQHQFLAAAQVDELRPLLPTFPDSLAFAKELIRRNWLTPYQVNQILQGNHDQLVLGGYRLRERLGEGSMGQVFKAWNLRMDRIVALKTIHKEHVNSAKALDRFRREMETASQLNHPNIALVRDADETEGRPYLVMDYIEGLNLSQRVKQQGPLPIHEAVEYTRQAALGLQHAFKRGIVHRDIKPSNLVVAVSKGNGEPLPVVKILDFGLARFESESEQSSRLTQVGNLLGTIDYIAPEQAQNARTADIRADIYSLGCSLFYMLAGQPPFGGTSVVEKLGPRLTGDPPSIRKIRPEVPAELDELLCKMMARRADARFQTPIEVAQALQPFASRESAVPVASGIVMAQVVPPEEMSVDEVPVAQPILAAPATRVFSAVETAIYVPTASPVGPDEPEPARVEDPSFVDMRSTGRDLSTGAAAATPPVAQTKKPYPLKLVAIIGGGLTAFLLLAVLSICLLGSFSGNDKPPRNDGPTGSLRITEAKFSHPDKTVAPGINRILVWVKRTDFKGPIKVTLKDLPPGVMDKPMTIPANADSGTLSLTVSHGTTPLVKSIRVFAEAEKQAISDEYRLELKVVENR